MLSQRHQSVFMCLLLLGIALMLIISPVGGAAGSRAQAQDEDLPETIESFDGEWAEVVAELEQGGVIGSGGWLVFTEDYAFVSGLRNTGFLLGEVSPFKDIVFAGELTYDSDPENQEYEYCSLASRAVLNEDNYFVRLLEVGLMNTGEIFYYDLYDDGPDDSRFEVARRRVPLTDPHHFLYIASGEELSVYVDGRLVFERVEVEDRSGIYAILIEGEGSSGSCEARDIWVYYAPAFTPGVCRASAEKAVNKRSGPGTNFEQMGKLNPGDSVRVIAQSEDSGGYIWWQLRDGSWVREDVVRVTGDCLNLPETDARST